MGRQESLWQVDNTSDYLAEALMKSVIHSSLIVIENPEDYEAKGHHQMEQEALSSSMQAVGYSLILQKTEELPNGKALVRLDYKKRKGGIPS